MLSPTRMKDEQVVEEEKDRKRDLTRKVWQQAVSFLVFLAILALLPAPSTTAPAATPSASTIPPPSPSETASLLHFEANCHIRHMKYTMEFRTDDLEAGFHEQGLCYTILDLFGAGTEATSTTLLWSFIYMMKYPEIQGKVQAEIDRVIGPTRQPCMADRPNMPYTDAVIHEIQRMGNIVPLNVPRITHKDTTLGGYFIPEGTQIIPNLTSVLFDETQWKSHSFDPQNFLNPQGEFVRPDAFLPFSAGKQVCPGESTAHMELFLFLTSLLQVFTLSPPAGTKPSLEFQFGITFSPKPFNMTARPRGQSSFQRQRVSASQ
ncbi:cytochrome P450 2J2-like [Electrophorus electricus]|uniref:cytochrome P450 2J2-like n=1 Tax=Electrophorus electricus TaxID=8005 RepID=UPI0015D00262|nr:cytochrome P450 2J2-like [Electrophorus electricus]